MTWSAGSSTSTGELRKVTTIDYSAPTGQVPTRRHAHRRPRAGNRTGPDPAGWRGSPAGPGGGRGGGMIEPPLTDPDATSPFLRAAGLRLAEVSPTRVTGCANLGPDHHTPWGWCTSACTPPSRAQPAPGQRGRGPARPNRGESVQPHQLPTIDDSRSDRRAGHGHQQGRTRQLWHVDIVDEAGRLIATGQVRLQNVEPRT
jgi:hypothetical protein